MVPPKWLRGGAYTPTVLATFLSLVAAPIGGLGVIALVFGAVVPGVIFLVAGIALWAMGRWLIDR